MTRVMLKRIPPPNIIHGVISAALPGKRNDVVNESPWRVDGLEDGPALIIVSVNRPDLQYIINKIGIISDKNRTLDYEPFLERVESEQTWNFRLCANPIEHKKINPTDKRGKIFALGSVARQIEWLHRQGEKHGFGIGGCYIIGDEWRAFQETIKGGKRNTVRIRAVTFDGFLTITDIEAFRTALKNGIGRGKAYGCGLLTIARIQL